ncbi:MAG TPA: hypothetical protein VGF75_01450, partial [Candidatus Saccharimonadales bacterium]
MSTAKATRGSVIPDETMHSIMAIRENIMEYYKGSCGHKFTRDRDIRLVNKTEFIERVSYWRQQSWEMEQDNPCILLLKDEPLFDL